MERRKNNRREENLRAHPLAQPGVRQLGQDVFVQDYSLRLLRQSWHQRLQDLDAVFVAPVVQDPPHEIHIRLLDRLLGEEIMRHELHPPLKFLGQVFPRLRYRAGQILDHELDLLGRLRQYLRNRAMPPSHIHDGSTGAVESCPVVAFRQVTDSVPFALGVIPHARAEPSGPLGVLAENLEDGFPML